MPAGTRFYFASKAEAGNPKTVIDEMIRGNNPDVIDLTQLIGLYGPQKSVPIGNPTEDRVGGLRVHNLAADLIFVMMETTGNLRKDIREAMSGGIGTFWVRKHSRLQVRSVRRNTATNKKSVVAIGALEAWGLTGGNLQENALHNGWRHLCTSGVFDLKKREYDGEEYFGHLYLADLRAQVKKLAGTPTDY
jgi:hypothetical protein